MTHTEMDATGIKIGEEELTNILKKFVTVYRFYHKNQSPPEIVIPNIGSVDGVKIRYAKFTKRSGDNPSKDKEVANATAS